MHTDDEAPDVRAHEERMTKARHTYPGRSICPDCYLPAGEHVHSGTSCAIAFREGVTCASSWRAG